MSDEYKVCDKCESETPPERMVLVELSESWALCEACVVGIEEEIEYNHWMDRYTEEHHERAIEVLSERDEITCVISDYENGAIVIHTPYVSADVVVDFCRHFGFRITDYRPQWHHKSDWPCAADHGDIFEVTLKYLPDSPQPSLVEAKFTTNRIEDIDSNDKQFE